MKRVLFVLGIVVLGAATAPSAVEGSQYEIVRRLVVERFDDDRDGQLNSAEESDGRHTFRSLFQDAGGFPIEIVPVLDPQIARVLEVFDQDNNQRLVREEKVECRRVLYVLLFAPKRSSYRNRMGPVAKPSREQTRTLVQGRRAIQANVGRVSKFGFYIPGTTTPHGTDVSAPPEFDNGSGGCFDSDICVPGIYQVDEDSLTDTNDDVLADALDDRELDGLPYNRQWDYPHHYARLREHMLADEWWADRLVPDPIAGRGYITRQGLLFINFVREYFNDDYPDNPDWWKDSEWWRKFGLSNSIRYRPKDTTDRQRRFLAVIQQVSDDLVRAADLPVALKSHGTPTVRYSSWWIIPDEALYKRILERVAEVLGVEIAVDDLLQEEDDLVGDISQVGDTEVSPGF